MALTHVSLVNPVGTVNHIHSTTSFFGFAGTLNVGPSTIRSGRICHPSDGHWTGGGASFASPFSAPASAHFAIVSISAGFSERSFVKWPYCGSANHGGILRSSTAAFIAFAHGRALSYVSNDIG